MIHFRMGRDDALRTRFAISPLHELPWARWAAPRAERIADSVDVVHRLIHPPGDWVPDFFSPPPETPLPDVAAELERVAAVPLETVRRELRRRYEVGGN